MGKTKQDSSGEISAQMKKVIENDNLLTEILVRIHPAIVVSFMCVSKRWLNLISSHVFRLYHSTLSPAYFPAASIIFLQLLPPSLQSRIRKFFSLLKNDDLVYEELHLSIPIIFDNFPTLVRSDPRTVSFEILHASNGLLLLSFTPHKTRYYVCNPLTRDYIQLPPISYGKSQLLQWHRQSRRSDEKLIMRLVFDPLKSAHYKVVCISGSTTQDDGRYIFVQVYSSTNRSWGNCKEISSSAEFRGIFYSVVLNDVLCWTTPPSGKHVRPAPGKLSWCMEITPSGKRLHIFDVSSLSIRSLPLPQWHEESLFHLCESRSILYLVETLDTDGLMGIFHRMGEQQTSNFSYKIWEMKDIGDSSWETKFEFQLEDRMEIMHVCCSHKEQGLQIFLAHNTLIYFLNSERYAVDKRLEYVGRLSSGQTQRKGYGIVSRMSRHWDIITYANTLFPLV